MSFFIRIWQPCELEGITQHLLVVGDGIKHGKLENVIHTLEAEIGRELRYTVFDTPDFHYRLSIYDKLVRDILDYPHIKVVDKLGVTD